MTLFKQNVNNIHCFGILLLYHLMSKEEKETTQKHQHAFDKFSLSQALNFQ